MGAGAPETGGIKGRGELSDAASVKWRMLKVHG